MGVAGDHVIVLITVPSREEGERIGRSLVEEKLGACVNIVCGVKSFFWWEGKVDEASECLLVVKTLARLFERIVARVKELHSYDVPEIIALPVLSGYERYMEWWNSVLA